MTPQGVLAVNYVGHLRGEKSQDTHIVHATLSAVFKDVVCYDYPGLGEMNSVTACL